MAKLTYIQLRAEVMALIEIEGTVVEQSVGRYLNWAGRRVYHSNMWHERKKRAWIRTFTPVSTDASGFDVTDETAIITAFSPALGGELPGGNFHTTAEAAAAGGMIAEGVGSPCYEVQKFNDVAVGAVLQLVRTWLDGTKVAADGIWYKDQFYLPADMGTIEDVGLIATPDAGRLVPLTSRYMNMASVMPNSTGLPAFWSLLPDQVPTGITGYADTTPLRRIRVAPIPNDEYGLQVDYVAKYVDLSADGDMLPLDAERESLVILAACLWAQKLADARKITTETEVKQLVKDAWEEQRRQSPVSARRQPFDKGGRRAQIYFDLSGIS